LKDTSNLCKLRLPPLLKLTISVIDLHELHAESYVDEFLHEDLSPTGIRE